jgi:integrase
MSADHPTRPAKPSKPYADFPLFAHATGRWAKKIRGQMHYFGPWADPNAALAKYLDQKDALHAGRKLREASAGTTVKDLCNSFLNAKLTKVESGELTRRSWEDYKAACELVVAHFRKGRLVADLDPDDFNSLRANLAKKWGPVTLGNVIQRIRVVFKFAWANGLIDRPVRYGDEFKRPSRKVMRLDRARKGPKLFTAGEVRRLIGASGPTMRAMILLGINCGFGNADCGRLPMSAVDLDAGVIDFPRPKTGIPRRCTLWGETVEAMREVLAIRPRPKHSEHTTLFFVTTHGHSWAKDTPDSPIAKEMKKLVNRLGIHRRKGLGFYTLRHTFRTVADEAKDQPAVDFIMGHEVPHMSAVYRETISEARLRAVAEHVRQWLFGATTAHASMPAAGDTAPSPPA